MLTWTFARFDELKAEDRLPSPPGVALALLRLTGTEGTTAEQIAKVMETDPVLVGRVLKLANSVLLGGHGQVGSTREAVVRVGMRAVSNLAVGCWLVSQGSAQACQRFDHVHYWQFSLAIAAAAKAVALRLKGIGPDEAFTCGLLSQVGRLALATVYPEAYAEILARCERDGLELLPQLEREKFAGDHTEITLALMEDWGLPSEYTDAVFFQSVGADALPNDTRGGHFARALDLGVELARIWVGTEEARAKLLPLCQQRAEQLGIGAAALHELADQAMAEWRQWGQLLNVTTPEVPSFAALARRPAEPKPAKAAAPAVIMHSDTGLRVLLVSADHGLSEFLAAFLAKAGHIPSFAARREEALCKMVEHLPQVLLVDEFRSGGEEEALCRHLRQARLGRCLYIVVLTQSLAEPMLSEIFAAGADDVLVKPVDATALTVRLRAALRVIGLQEGAQRDKDEMRRFALELAVANRRLQHTAFEDVLTRLPNRRCALQRLGQEWARAERSGRPLACIIADIDHFKKVNDTYGHDMGDKVLQATAEVMNGAVRASDLVCRLGGEEFVILCADTDIVGARQCAERLRVKVADNRVSSAKLRLAVTVSMGVAARVDSMRKPEELLTKADQAVYRAKQAGRNRVCV